MEELVFFTLLGSYLLTETPDRKTIIIKRVTQKPYDMVQRVTLFSLHSDTSSGDIN